jgi:hypothetical protein
VQDTRRSAARATEPLQRLARYLSVVGHPFIVIPASVGAVSVLRGGDTRVAASVAFLFIAVSLGILVGIRAGRFNDFDVSERQRRPPFYILVVGATVTLGVWLRHEPGALRACAIASAVLAACGLVNRWTKASLHTAFALYVAGLWGAWSVSAGLVALAIAASVAWSRAHLGRHSWREVCAGAAIGLVGGGCSISFASHGW